MKSNQFKQLLFVPFILVILVLASCQKNTDITDPAPLPEEVKDSTLLIKSIKLTYNVEEPYKDSVTEYYSYDSVNRKIILSWDDPDIPAGAKAEFSYNANNLLSRIDFKYPAGYTPTGEEYSSIEIFYDVEKVLQKATLKFVNGSGESTSFNKSALTSGRYQLTWEEKSAGYLNDIIKRSAIFDSKGNNILQVQDFSDARGVTGNGGEIYTNIIITDSLIYDANGNLSRMLTNFIDTLEHINDNFTWYEFTSRRTQGDQLFNQRQILFNGIAAIPFGNSYRFPRMSILNFTPPSSEHLQFSRYPFISATVFDYFGSYGSQQFYANSEIDSKGRLLKFRCFFNDGELIPMEYNISYFK